MSEQLTTILYVEDREENRYIISRRLRDEGFRVIEAHTGQEALEKFNSQIDCVLLDVKLPDIPGFEVCKQIRMMKPDGFLPVVMISATYIEEAYQVLGLEGGADAYLIQPISDNVMVATLKALIRVRQDEKDIILGTQATATYEERQRLARDLHDSISRNA